MSDAAPLLRRADAAIAAARRDLAAVDPDAAVERAAVAMHAAAAAALAPEGVPPLADEAVRVAYGRRFGRGGTLYSAYHRWLLDAADFARAVAAGVASADEQGAAAAVERAEIFRDAVARFVARP